MADVTIIAGTHALSNQRAFRNVVTVGANVVYFFYVDTAADLFYKKSTDGGATWGSAVTVYTSGTGGVVAFDCWFDQWTPGDPSPLINIWYMTSTSDEVLFRTLDTSSDTLGTQRLIFTATSTSSAREIFITGAKMRGANLYCAFDINTTQRGLYRSTDGGANWSGRTSPIEAFGDQCTLYPGNESDSNDAWMLYDDVSTNELTLKVHDDSADTNSESAVIASMTESTTDGTGQYPWSGAIRHSDGHLICALVTEANQATQDHRVFDINGTGSIVEKTALTTNIDDNYYSAVMIDTSNRIYIAYCGKSDGSETHGTSVGVYYARSTNGGATWVKDSVYSAAISDWRQSRTPLNSEFFMAVWRDASANDWLTNADNVVLPTSTPRSYAVIIG